MQQIFPRLHQAIIDAAPTDDERAAALGVHRNTIQRIKSGEWSLLIFKHLPQQKLLAHALREDLDAIIADQTTDQQAA